MLALTDGRVFTGESILDGHAVLLDGERIAAVLPQAAVPSGVERRSLGGGLLAPGFVDVQVNGGGGVLFNDAPTAETLRTIGAAHRRFGTTGFLPTLISDTRATMAAALAAVRAAPGEGVLGIHLEGPFLNPARRGVHAAAMIRAPEPEDIDLILPPAARGRGPLDPFTDGGPGPQAPAAGGITLVTLAPEAVPPGLIARLAGAGVIVSAGHTAATYDRIAAALAEGLTGFTHLFNAMTPFGSREPGVVGAALADGESWCGLIADGHHVHPASLKAAIAAKRRGRMMLVTDAMPPVGAAEPSFTLYGERITAAGGRCATADGTLAGSALDMAAAVRNAVRLLGLPVEEALRMASAYPADFLGLGGRLGRIAPVWRADLVLLDGGLQVVETWIAGRDSAAG